MMGEDWERGLNGGGGGEPGEMNRRRGLWGKGCGEGTGNGCGGGGGPGEMKEQGTVRKGTWGGNCGERDAGRRLYVNECGGELWGCGEGTVRTWMRREQWGKGLGRQMQSGNWGNGQEEKTGEMDPEKGWLSGGDCEERNEVWGKGCKEGDCGERNADTWRGVHGKREAGRRWGWLRSLKQMWLTDAMSFAGNSRLFLYQWLHHNQTLSPPCSPLLFIVWGRDCPSVRYKQASPWMIGVLYELATIIAINCSQVSKHYVQLSSSLPPLPLSHHWKLTVVKAMYIVHKIINAQWHLSKYPLS